MVGILNIFSSLWWRLENRKRTQSWVRIIYRDDRPLITRYYLFSTRWIEDAEWIKRHPRLQRFLLPLSQNLVIHHAHESDPNRGLHDHPWAWASLILSGGYWEETPIGRFWRYPGHLRFRYAEALHRLELDPVRTGGKEVFSLFWMGHRQRIWGFIQDDGSWVPWYNHDRARDPTVSRTA